MTHTPANLSVAVLAVGNALDPVASRQLREMPAGGTVRSYALAFWPLLPPEYEIGVAIDGRPIADAMELTVEPGQSLMLVVVPKGGGGGGKNILGIVASVALMVAAPYLAPASWVNALGAAAFNTGMFASVGSALAFGSAIIGGAINIAGGLLISAVMGGGTGGGGDYGSSSTDLTNSATYSWDQSPNPIAEGKVCPVLWGTMRVTPPMIGRYITSTEDGKQTVNFLYLVADHALDSITDIEINGNPSTYYTDVTIETRLGAVDQTVISNFSDTISEKQGAAVLSTSYATLRTDGNAVEGLGVSLVCDQGLYYANNSGGLDTQSISVLVEYKKVGDLDWIPFSVTSSITTNERGLFGYSTYYYGDLVIYGGVKYFVLETFTSAQVISGTGPIPWEVYTGQGTSGTLTISGSTTSALRRYVRQDNVPAGQYDIRVKLQTAPTTGPRHRNRCIFESIQEIVYDDFRYPGASLLSVKALATDQLSGGLPTITCLATRSTVPVWTGAAYENLPATNPAWACYDLMHNDEYGGGIPYSRIVYDELDSWADWCTAEGHTVNLYVDEAINFQKLSQTIAICGRGRIDQIGSKFTCAVDRPITLPVQKFLFTMGNIVPDSFAEEWMSMEDRANVIEVTYIDKDASYSRQVVEVRSQDFDTTTIPVNKGAYTLLGVTSRDKAVAYGNFLINSNRYLTNTVSFDVDIEGLGCLPGDVVDVSHDVPQWGYSGRLVAATMSTVTLDREVTLSPGTAYALNVKLSDDTRDDVVIQGVSVETTTDVLTIGGAWAGAAPAKYDHYSFGETNRQSKLFRIISTSRNSDQRCKVVALEYVDEVYDDGAVIPTPEVTSDLPCIVSLRATENFEIISGIPTPRIDLTWRGNALSWQVSCRETGGAWRDCGTVYAPGKSIPGEDLNPGTEYEFMVTTGNIQSTTTIAYNGGPTPEDVTGVYAFLQSGALYLSWDSLNLPWAITYEVRKGSSWETSQTIGSTSSTLLQITGPGTYFVAAKSGTQYSATPSSIAVTDESLTENVIATWDEKDTLWTGTRTDGIYIVGDELWLVGSGDFYAEADIYTVGDIWTLGGVTPSATYTIPAEHIIDVGVESICNIQIEYSLRGDGVYDDIYDDPDIYAIADIYGGYGAFVRATPEIRTYRSGAWGPWVAYSPGQYTGEQFEARITVESADTATIAVLEEFTFSVDVPDRIDKHKGVTVPVTGLTFTHSPEFHGVPTTVIQILSANAGDDDIITNETATGFDLIIHNGGSPVERDVNIISAGY